MALRLCSSIGRRCRNLNTTPPKSDSVLSRVKDFIFSSDKENFHADFIQRAYKWDRLSRTEWKLIYRDIGASRSFVLVSVALPAAVVGVVALGCDWLLNTPTQRSSLLKRLLKDCQELGVLVIFPIVAVVAVALLLARVHSCRVLRIYQNKRDVDTFIAVRSQWVVKQHKMKFDKNTAAAFYYDEDRELLKLMMNFVFGNIQIGRRKMFVLDECFLGNNYRSYMLNETSVPPQLTTRKK